MTDHTFADVSYEIASEIGRDVDYVRTKSDASGERLYMTGIELGALLGTAAAISFLIGILKGLVEAGGEATGKALVKSLLLTLSRLLGRTKHVNQEDLPVVKAELQAVHGELDGTVRQELQMVVSKRLYIDGRTVAESTARLEVQSTLESFGLPSEKATALADVATKMLSASMVELLR